MESGDPPMGPPEEAVDEESGWGMPPPPPILSLAISSSSNPPPVEEMGFARFKRHLESLLSMGFPVATAEESLFRTRNESIEAAVDWILSQNALDLATLEEDAATGRPRALVSPTDPPPPVPPLVRHRTDPFSAGVAHGGGAGPLASLDLATQNSSGLGLVLSALLHNHETRSERNFPRARRRPLAARVDEEGDSDIHRDFEVAVTDAAAKARERRDRYEVYEDRDELPSPSSGHPEPWQLSGDMADPAGSKIDAGDLETKMDEFALELVDMGDRTVSTCNICYADGVPEAQHKGSMDDMAALVSFPRCGHEFCKDCAARYLYVNISEGKVLRITCPCAAVQPCACGNMLPFEIERLLHQVNESMWEVVEEKRSQGLEEGKGEGGAGGREGVALLDKYQRFCDIKNAEKDPNTRWCTKPGCETAIRPGAFWTSVSKKMVCPNCSTAVCSRCGRDYHGFMSCGSMTDAALAEYSRKKFLQPCPSCHRLVEKLNACPHITCPCGHQWCWVCRDAYPCAHLHFGYGGYGSSEEIGDLRIVWRLAVLARMLLVFAMIYLLVPVAVFFASLYLAVVLLVLPCVLGTVCYSFVADGDGDNEVWTMYSKMLEPVPPIILAPVVLASLLVILAVAIAVIHIFGALSIVPLLVLSLADAVSALLKPILRMRSEENYELQRPASSLWTADFTSERNFESSYGGALAVRYDGEDLYTLCRTMRAMAAGVYLTLTMFPGIALSLVFLPVAPCCLCPLLINPLGTQRFSAWFRFGASLVAGAVVGLGIAFGMGYSFGEREDFDDDGLNDLVNDVGLSAFAASLLVCIGTTLVVYMVLTYPPVSNFAFAAPLWIGSISPALVIALPEGNGMRKLAFGPTPTIVQLFD